jgi:amylosucrase
LFEYDERWLDEQVSLTLLRLLPRISSHIVNMSDRDVFMERLNAQFPRIFKLLYHLYGQQYDFFYHLETILIAAADMFAARPDDLKQLDYEREHNPDWFQSEQMMGAVCYVDLFAGNLAGIRERIPYFKELGLTYLHLMPLFRSPAKNNDGGYAVSDFREVNPALGTMEDLALLARELRQHGISLVLDFVFNHTSDEHAWALKALAGDKEYQAYYWMFDNRTMPDLLEPNLREIFPEQAPGSFTYRPEIQKWVWTTFYNFQWDLNYSNPALFGAMLQEMLFLANQGIEFLRLDAVPFIWKQLGTNCENLPEAHIIIQAFNAFVRLVAPALIFKSEAIVHPRDVRSYISPDECQVSYNPIMMVSLWEALATRDVRFMRHTMSKHFAMPSGCAWINYIRSHDDIGWGFADEDAVEVGINGFDHRYFLNAFYTGRFPGSFATGLPFNYNPRTQDMRIAGMAASLAGLEQAISLDNPLYIENAIRRILMMYGIVLSAGGIPLIYFSDELGTINDYAYLDDPRKAHDSRWMHRPFFKQEKWLRRLDETTIEGRIFQKLVHYIKVRKSTPELANGETVFVETGNRGVLGFTRHSQILVLANFTDFPQAVALGEVVTPHLKHTTPSSRLVDLLSNQVMLTSSNLTLNAYGIMWLKLLPS